MNKASKLIPILQKMKGLTLDNYVIAGLSSSLISQGKVRLFENSRSHLDYVTPHSHRFSFTCLVLRGHVINQIWEESIEGVGDFFEESILEYKDAPGDYNRKLEGRNWYSYTSTQYEEGEIYSMARDEIHSIQFSKDAVVLFLEGPTESNTSIILEPVVDGQVIRTMEIKDYMFKVREEGESDG